MANPDPSSDSHDTGAPTDYTNLFRVAREAIAAGFNSFVAAVWLKSDGTLGKSPLTRHGHLQAHRDIQRLFQELVSPPHIPDDVPNDYDIVVGIVPGSANRVMADCDKKLGKQGEATLRRLISEHGEFVYSAWRSPSGGTNILAIKPPGFEIVSNSSPWPGIDIRADHGWAVAPGNQTRWGNWEWIGGSGYQTAEPLPAGMIAQLKPGQETGPSATNQELLEFIQQSIPTATLPALEEFNKRLPEYRGSSIGSRHDALKKIIGHAFGYEHLDLDHAMQIIVAVWNQIVPLDERRENEPWEMAAWTAGQEISKRASKQTPPAPMIVNYQNEDDDAFLVNWSATATESHIIEGLIIPGRWLQLVSAAKQGKSSLEIFTAIELSEGRHPFDGTPIDPIPTLYLDGEMGLKDLKELIESCGHDPEKLAQRNLNCSIARLRLDQDNGAERLLRWIDKLQIRLLFLDGLNGFINPDASENDSETWNAIYSRAIIPIKQRGIAIVSGDNMGRDPAKQGGRGSSIKMDKADGVIAVKRNDTGVKLTTTHSRAGAYSESIILDAEGFDRSKPIRYWFSNQTGWLHGTAAVAATLDSLHVPIDWGRDKVRKFLRDKRAEAIANGTDHTPFESRNDVLSDALRYRRSVLFPTKQTPPKPVPDRSVGQPNGTVGQQSNKSWSEAQDNPVPDGTASPSPRKGTDPRQDLFDD